MKLNWLSNWEITLTEKVDLDKGMDDPVLAQSIHLIKEQFGIDYADLAIHLDEEGYAVICPKKK